MYRFLDRPVEQLDEHHRFLVAALRRWTFAARQCRCACHALSGGFARRGVAAALPHFAILMATLDHEASMTLRFGDLDAPEVSDDEARLLALFASAIAGDAATALRQAEQLVETNAVQRVTTAAGMVAYHFAATPLAERDREARQ